MSSVLRVGAFVRCSVAMLVASAALADTPDQTDGTPTELQTLIIKESGLNLDKGTETGNRLGLTVRETPATIDVLTQEQMIELGARTTMEAFNRVPGLTSSNVATSPGMLTTRGFPAGAIAMVYDDVRPASTGLFTRVMDTWGLERIEVLKGPSSVLFGQSALAGTVNLVPKKPRIGVQENSALLGYGSFGTLRLAGDTNIPVSDSLAVRAVASYYHTDEYIDDSSSTYTSGTVSLQWRPIDPLTVDIAVDLLKDDYDSAYFGTPLVPREFARAPSNVVQSDDGRVIDEAMRKVNYNFRDGIVDSDTQWLRTRIGYDITQNWTLSNQLNFYHSDRTWKNAEFYGFNPSTNLVDRSTGIVTHEWDYWINRTVLTGYLMLGGMRNRVSLGGEYSDVSFFTQRRFGSDTSVDPYNPDRGFFPIGDNPTVFPSRSDRDSSIKNSAIFAENAINLTQRWLFLLGVRYDDIDLDRVSIDLNAATSAPVERRFTAFSWRTGTVFDLLPKTQLFAQYSTAVVPPADLFSVTPAQRDFDLSTGESVEVGVKSTFMGNRMETTFSVFRMNQDDILTRDPNDPTSTIQGGERSSRGVELALSAAVTPQFRVSGNYTLLDAQFDTLIEAGGVNRAGNTPPNVPEKIANLFAHYSLNGLPLMLSAGVHYLGGFYTDNANSIRVSSYTTLEAAVTYRLPFGDLTLRGRNLTDELYADYTDMSPDQLALGPPRSVDLTLTASF